MGYPPRPYVNCHFCNARLAVGLGRLAELQKPEGALIACQSCGNQDRYEGSSIRDALLVPSPAPKDASAPLAEPEPARGLRRSIGA
mgnify:FL=1